jgi:hypothetical protein
MGIICLPSFHDYWSTKLPLHCFAIANRTSRNRFFEIKKFLHFVDNEKLGENVVLKLSEPLSGGYYHLYFDNFFTSVSLLEKLLERKIYACGTYRKDRRNLPQDLKNIKESKKTKCTMYQFVY